MTSEVPPALLDGPFRARDAYALGVTKHQLRGDRFRRVFTEVYVCATIPDGLDLRCRAARLVLPDHAVFCDLTAARLCRLPVPETDQRIHVALPAATTVCPQTRGIKVHLYALGRQDLWVPAAVGWRMVRPERLFLELAQRPSREELIVAGDQLLHHGWTTKPLLEKYLSRCTGMKGRRKASEALPLIDGGSDSPPETLLRLLLIDAGLPRPAVNEVVRDHTGQRLAKPDLSYPELKIAIQYEGRHHQEDREQYVYDIERDARLIQQGWIVLRIPAECLHKAPELIITRVRHAIEDRRSSA